MPYTKDSPVIKKIKADKSLRTKKKVRQDNAVKKYGKGATMKKGSGKPMRKSQRGR